MAQKFQPISNSVDLYEQALNIERQKISLQEALAEGNFQKARYCMYSLRDARHFQAENSYNEELKSIEFREQAALLREKSLNVRVAQYQAYQGRGGQPLPDLN